ncbi:MAG: DUF547 domain-containing protein [Phycisphaerales bacterium]|nr:DUF547 domain-containing protein [Phycisphaerales bacterium]
MDETQASQSACGLWCGKRLIAIVIVVVAAVGVLIARQLLVVDDVPPAASISHANWDGVLQSHVNDLGRVDYAGIASDDRFARYLELLGSTNAGGLAGNDDRLAFWINAYNALTIRAVLDTLPNDETAWPDYRIIDQKVNGKSLWKGRVFDVGGERRTLDEIEHEILRKRDGLRDPRIHVALVCAARGCPLLWNRAYTGANVRNQLADAMRRFANDPRQFEWDEARNSIRASRILEWYGVDFTDLKFIPHSETIASFVANYVDDATAARGLRGFRGEMTFNEYDWRLNIQQSPTSTTASGD